MKSLIRPMREHDIEHLIQFTISAFEPIFSSFANILGPDIFTKIYPDWKMTQANEVKNAWTNEMHHAYVAEQDGTVIGLITYELRHDSKTGEVHFLVVDPAYQNEGVGSELNDFALQKMQEAGMVMAEVGTGGDGSHAAARRAYEKAGYTALPIVRYYKNLDVG